MDALFDPPNDRWTPVSQRLTVLRRLRGSVSVAVVGLVLVVASLIWPGWLWLTALVVVAALGVGLWIWLWAARNQRSWGYAENDEDLWVKHGVAWRHLTAVPYGRMQYVDVTAGPLERYLGIAVVHLHTAASETSAVIPGLLADDATRLRDRLTELGETRGSGI